MKLSSWICLICPRIIKLHPNIAVTSNSNNTIYEVPVTALLWPQQQQADGFGIYSEFFKNSAAVSFSDKMTEKEKNIIKSKYNL